ncbi:type II secretion system protein [Clostridium sp.]|uniref:PilW family protein n=1 Tax=Clostridium sp. TaxID=1506 RepID=UPI00290A55DE|nr:type II secretion system protein [Clostridium sp.]MDU5107374.1 type II secretion system protein [Clostridium sp.]
MKKKKGFTLLELIIVLALTLVVIGVASTFFISTIKTFKRAEISSNLQLEAEQIEGLLLAVGLQSEGIEEVNNLNITSTSKRYYRDILNLDGKLETNKVKFKLLNDYYTLEKENEKLVAKKYNNIGQEIGEGGYPKVLSENIREFTIRPVDFRMKPNSSLYEMKAVEINIKLEDVKGSSGVEVPLSLIIKFRNK